ncbi:MAG: hypothetical protein QG602_1857 [Verrucomicrobiota bacterium]|nr:hypothetical protein [Verrucomicrobiota bacterium]
MPNPTSPSAPGFTRQQTWLLVLLAAASPAVFAAVTDNIWEDFFITYRCSLNLVRGEGLVYEVGRRLHVFTSPLGVLLPSGFAKLLGTEDPLLVMQAFRVFSCLVLAAAWAVVAGRLPGIMAALVTAAFWFLDPKLAAYSTNGMETALLVLFVLLAWRAMLDGRMVVAGLALGGAMWTRPDGFVFVGALAVGVMLFPAERRPGWRGWLTMAVTAGVVYLPWFAWAWAYYGTPVPNTIQAKGTHLLSADSLGSLATYPWRYFFGRSTVHDAFLPPYFFFGGWPDWLGWYGRVLAVAAAVVAAWPRCARPARIAGLGFVLGGAYLTVTTRAPWYFPMWQIMAYIAIGGGVTAVAGLPAMRGALRRGVLFAGVGLAVAVQAWLFVAVAVQLREQQRLIEWGLRAPLGRALAKAARSPQDTVFLEPLGYIGFYSGLSMRDTPGLCAPEVIRLRRAGTLAMSSLATSLRTDWAILRGMEFLRLSPAERAELEKDYMLWTVFDEREKVQQVGWLPGRDFLLFDAHYSVWRRRDSAAPAR